MAKKQSFDNSAFEEFDNSAFEEFDNSAFEEFDNSAFEDLSTEPEETVKKKEQEELPQEETPQMEVQEDTESVSEDGSSVSQDWGGDQKKPVRTALTVEEEDFKTLEEKGKLEKPEEKITLESFGTPSTEEEKIKESEVYIAKKQDEAENAVSVFLEKNNLNSIDVLPSDISESVKEMYPGTYTSSIERALYSVRNKELNSAAEDLINKERESIISGNSDLGKVSKEVADSLMYKKTLESSLKSLGLSDDDYEENVDAIKTRYNSLIQISNLKKEFKNASDSRKRQIIEEVEELKELSKLSSDKLSFLRENNKAFTDEEGNVNKDLKRDVESREVAFNKEFKSDYVKIIDRLAKEKAKKDALIKKLAEEELEVKKQNPEFYNNFDLDFESAEKGLSLNLGFSSDYLNAPNPKDYISSENREKQMSYRELFSEANKNLLALSRLALLNEDPAAVAKGFEFLKGTKIEGVGKFITAATETIAEEITGDDVVTDRDFRQNAINVLRQEGVNLTPDQLEAGEQDFSETLGDTFGVSTVMGGKIALTSYMLGGIGNALKLPSYLARIKYLRESPRLVSFIDKTMKAVGEGLAFELADDRTDFFMGVGESGGKGAMKLLGKALASSKFGKFSKYLDNYVGRFATNLTGRIVGGVTEEYSGEWISEGVKNGFFTQEQFENTFGKGQQAAEKFILNIALAGGMGLPSSFIESVKSRADQDQTGELRKAVDAYEEGLKSKPEIKKETLDKVEEKGGLSEMTTEEIEGTLKEEDLEVLTAEKEKIKSDDKKEEEPVPSAVEEGQEPGDIQVDETGEEEATTGGVLQEEEVAEVEPSDITAKPEEVVEADTFTQEELETPEVESKLTEEQKKVNNISKAINKVAPGVEFVFHKTEDSYNNSSEQDVSGSRGYRDGDKVHIDLSSVKDNTSFHEAIHPVLDAVFNKSPETYNKLVSSMKTDPEFESYFESAKQNYEGENTQVNEALTEMMADVASGKYNKGTSVYEKVKDFVKEILSKLGLRQSDFNIDLNKEVDVRQFAENIGKALAKGKEITFEKEGKLIQEKIADAVSKGKESLLEVSKSYFESTKDNLSDIALKAYEKINGTSKVTQEGFTKALEKSKEFAKEVADIVSKGKDFVAEKIPSTKDVVESITEKLSKPVESAKEFRSVLSEVISEGKDSFYEKVNNTSKITSEGISKATKKAKESLDKTYEKVKDNISGKALDIYKSINKTAEITKEGFIKASIVSKNFLNEVLKVYAKGLDALGDIAKESSRFVVGLSAAAVISNSYPVIKGYNKMGVDGAIYEVIKENKWAVDALQGTELGDKLNSALGRLEFKTGDAVGGESVSIEEANEVSKTVKSVEEISVEDDVSPEVRKFIADNTTFEISKKKIPLSRRGKRMGVSAHIQNQFPADSGFIYISAPTVGSNVPFSADALAVAQFQLDGSISDNQTYKGGESEYTKGVPGHYMHKNNDAILRVAKQRNDYVPVFEKLGDNKVRVRYKRYNELEKGERIMSPLRQFKYSEIAWGQETQASDFAKGMKALPLKKGVKYPYPGKKGGNQTDIIFGGTYKNPRTGKVSKGSDRYGLYEGIGAVFIFKDKNGTTWVREFNGSANQVAAKGREIIKEFNIKPEDLTVGYHDVGSYSARPLAEKGKVGTNLYTGKREYNGSPETGGALYYPPKDVNFQKKGGQRGDTFNKAKESYKKSREAGLDIKESISESFKTIERADWYKSLTKEEQAEIKADYVNRLVPNFESEGKPPKRNRKGKPPVDSSRKIITTEKKSLLAKLKNQAKGAKTLMKAQTGLINELFKEISNSSKSLTSNELKAVLKKASKLDPADITKVLEFKDEVKKLIDKGEIRDKKKLAFSNRARINKAKKKLTGKKKAFADTFSKLNINRVTDLDAYNEVAQSIIDSANKRKASSLEKIKELGDRVISETNKAQEDFNAERQRLSDIALEEEFEAFQESMYEKSNFKKRGGSLEEYKKFLSSEEGFMSLEDYKRIKEQAYRESLSNQSREKIEQAEQQLRDFISNRLEYLKSNKESITKDMTPFEKAVVNDLIKSASLLKRTDLTSSDNLFDISQALDEILTFNSTSGVNKASVALDAIKDSNIAKIKLKDKLASGILAGYPTAGSLSTYAKAATKNEQAAKEFASLFFGKYNDSFKKSKNKTEQFLKRRAEKRNELKIKRKESQRIGIVSWLMQHDEGSTEEEIQLDLDQKKESIKQQIKTLSGSKGNASDRRKAKRMQEAYDSLGLDNVKTKKELNTLLNKNELDFLNFLTEEFQELKQPLQDAYSAAKGEDLTFVENYLPTFARKYSDTSKEDLEGLVFDNKSIQSNPSGRTKKRTKIDTTGNVIYNFDVLGTTEAGYSQAAGDIYTLYDKQVLSQVVMSKPVKELWKNDPKGYRTFKERVALLLKNRNPNYATDAARANRFLQISNNILRTAIALPLRTTDQLGKQVVPIIGNTVAKLVLSRGRPVAGVKGFSYIGSLMGSDSSPTKQNLKKLLSFSNTSLRVLEGDRDLAATKGLTEQAQKEILEAVRLGKLNEKVLSKLGSGALGFADKLASQGSWLSFYISERIDQEGKGFKFDLEKEAENPNMKAIEKANVETDWINNKSDMTTAAKSVYENKKTALIVKDLFFLFKSFAINQSYNTALDIRNIGYGVSKSFKKKESKEGRQDTRDAAASLLGTIAGVYLFEMVKESFIKPGTDELVEALFDIEDPDPEKEVLGDIKRDSKKAFMKGAMDIVVGAAPESISRGFKEYANSLIIDAAKEDYEELKNKFPGADIEPFSEYKQKVFYDKSSAPGFLGRTADLGAEAFRDFQIITGDEGLGQEDQFGREKELSPKMKTIALFNMLAPFVGAGDIKKYTEKALRNAKKNAKNKK